MLSTFPRGSLLRERAILLSRINQHTQALTIYAHHLKRPDLAEEYCSAHYKDVTDRGTPANINMNLNVTASDDEKNMYLNLLKVYLKPPDNIPPLTGPALTLLHKHYMRMDCARALHLIPDNTPIVMLLPFFKAVLSKNAHTRRKNQITKHLLRAEHLQVRRDNLAAGRPRVEINLETKCSRCGKRIGSSAFARYPSGVIMHYICYTAAQVGSQVPGTGSIPQERDES